MIGDNKTCWHASLSLFSECARGWLRFVFFFCFIFWENLYCLLLFFIPFLSIYNIYLRKLAPHRRLLATAKAPGKSSKREQFISFFFFFLRFIFLGRSASFSNSAVCALRETRLSSAWKGHAHVPLEARKVRQPKAIRKRIGKQNVETKEKLDKRLFIFYFRFHPCRLIQSPLKMTSLTTGRTEQLAQHAILRVRKNMRVHPPAFQWILIYIPAHKHANSYLPVLPVQMNATSTVRWTPFLKLLRSVCCAVGRQETTRIPVKNNTEEMKKR